MDETHRVFVYGTLMRGEHHHDVLADASYVGPARTRPVYELWWMEYYPALLRGGRQSVRGEVYRVSESVLRALDALEEHPDVYQRERDELADGTAAFLYVLRPAQVEPGAERIESGDFRDVPAHKRRP